MEKENAIVGMTKNCRLQYLMDFIKEKKIEFVVILYFLCYLAAFSYCLVNEVKLPVIEIIHESI